MKKGCFIKSIIILTILVAAALYIIQNKFDDFILKPGKKFILPVVKENFRREMLNLKPSPEKDSLITLVDNYFKELKENNNISSNHIKKIAEVIEDSFKDSIITENELHEISKLISSGRSK